VVLVGSHAERRRADSRSRHVDDRLCRSSVSECLCWGADIKSGETPAKVLSYVHCERSLRYSKWETGRRKQGVEIRRVENLQPEKGSGGTTWSSIPTLTTIAWPPGAHVAVPHCVGSSYCLPVATSTSRCLV
jgi:hypothetical protein